DLAAVRAGASLVRQWGIGFYCVQPWAIGPALEALRGTPARVVAVLSFPHGCDATAVKIEAARAAAAAGAAELDMVMNVGLLKSGEADRVREDIAGVVRAARVPVKVILETCLLSQEEKVLACRLAQEAGAAFVKTSTGFGSAGATVEDVRLLRQTLGSALGVKAAGGIRTLQDALAMLEAGASRLGTSASAAILGALPAG
ncbi:MAG TPA: deoxyribose-phosphate aldolase, partial [Candidatus Methylomirabilis sp.]|nr:deoxyribose-phosphate aldolase [Candidatus Methylomirabilis sp.]